MTDPMTTEWADHRAPGPSKLVGLLIAVVTVVVLAVVGFVGLRVAGLIGGGADYSGPGYGSVTIQVHSGDTASAIGRTLQQADVVKSAEAFVSAAKSNAASRNIQVGYYVLKYKMRAKDALAILINPKNLVQAKVTVIEGERVEKIITDVVARTKITEKDLRAALAAPAAIGLPSEAEGNPEGYLYPATYLVTPGETAAQLLSEMVARAKAEYTQLNVDAGAAALGLTPHQLITMASLLEYEGKRPQDLPKIARVFYNRLAAKMPLQSDATVAFANNLSGTVWTNAAQRNNPSPYNTYVHPGLPPGPIGSPGEVAIQAALNPAAGPWLYFAPINLDTGETAFATTYAEHQANVAKLNAWCAQTKSPLCK